jgi:transcriptional antiterminator
MGKKMSNYQVKKILNNNIVLCFDIQNEQECITVGKGIGFQKNSGDFIDESIIEKVYFRKDNKKINQYLDLLSRCDEQLIVTVEELINIMEQRFGNHYDEYIHIALLDHLNFSVYRLNNNIQVNNIFLEEFSVMYEKEYIFAKEALMRINDKLGIQLPDVEAGFITLHVHAALNRENASKSALYMQIINDSIAFIEKTVNQTIPNGSLERMRLVTHLKFALERAGKKQILNNPILESLKKQLPDTYKLAQDLSMMIEEQFGMKLHDGEIGYLTLHIQNIKTRLEEGNNL